MADKKAASFVVNNRVKIVGGKYKSSDGIIKRVHSKMLSILLSGDKEIRVLKSSVKRKLLEQEDHVRPIKRQKKCAASQCIIPSPLFNPDNRVPLKELVVPNCLAVAKLFTDQENGQFEIGQPPKKSTGCQFDTAKKALFVPPHKRTSAREKWLRGRKMPSSQAVRRKSNRARDERKNTGVWTRGATVVSRDDDKSTGVWNRGATSGLRNTHNVKDTGIWTRGAKVGMFESSPST